MVTTLTRNGATKLPTNTGAEFDVTFDNGETKSFFPLQYHVHSPSEHTINGESFDLELHIVHVDSAGAPAAVIGVLFDVSNSTLAYNYDLDLLWPRGTASSETGELDLASFLRNINFRDFYNYPGSLTTPPCTEGINWFVLKEVQTISKA